MLLVENVGNTALPDRGLILVRLEEFRFAWLGLALSAITVDPLHDIMVGLVAELAI